eukprot:TRINITY_DN60703_c0_g1_i1.p1 TRINITY_DN60703_c0_g1~~TRINITY_DN60703_c0_g1_i1.p1  ORF type:complete len:729 (+),score=120.05 TRINITY_DN60703_c0_g1_i1:90-2189(+)
MAARRQDDDAEQDGTGRLRSVSTWLQDLLGGSTGNVAQEKNSLRGHQAPPKGAFALAEVAGFVLHASSSQAREVDVARRSGRIYHNRWLAKGCGGVAALCARTSGQHDPPTLPQPPRLQQGRAILGCAVDQVRQLGRLPYLGGLIHHGLHLGPSPNVPDEYGRMPEAADPQPAAKRRRITAAASEDEPPRLPPDEQWSRRYHCPPGVGEKLNVVALAWHPAGSELAILARGQADHGAAAAGSLPMDVVYTYDLAGEHFTRALRCAAMVGSEVIAFNPDPASIGTLAVGGSSGVVLWDLVESPLDVAKGLTQVAVMNHRQPPAPTAATPCAPAARARRGLPTRGEVLTGFEAKWRSVQGSCGSADQAGPAVWQWSKEHAAPVTTLAFSNSGCYLAVGATSSAEVCIADLRQPWEEAIALAHRVRIGASLGGARHVSFSPDDRLLLVTTGHRPLMALYRTDTWAEAVFHVGGLVCHPAWHPKTGALFFHLQGGRDIITATFPTRSQTRRLAQLRQQAASGHHEAHGRQPQAGRAQQAAQQLQQQSGSSADDAVVPTIVAREQVMPYGDPRSGDPVGAACKEELGAATMLSFALDPTGCRAVCLLRDGLLALYDVALDVSGNPALGAIGLVRMHADAGGLSAPALLSWAPRVREGAVLSTVWPDGLLAFLPCHYPRQAGGVATEETAEMTPAAYPGLGGSGF